jgi:hypothetical protein
LIANLSPANLADFKNTQSQQPFSVLKKLKDCEPTIQLNQKPKLTKTDAVTLVKASTGHSQTMCRKQDLANPN